VIGNTWAVASSYLSSYMASSDHNADGRALMRRLEEYVDDDDAENLKILFANEQDFGELSTLLKISDYSILHHAAEYGKFDALRTMIETFPFEAMDSRAPYGGRTLLMSAAEHGHRDLLWLCHDALQEKCRQETDRSAIESVRRQLGYETEIDRFDDRWKRLVNSKDNDGMTPLWLAVENRHLQCAVELLKWEAETDQRTHSVDIVYGWVARGVTECESLLFDLVLNAKREDMCVAVESYQQKNGRWEYGINPHKLRLMRTLGCSVTMNDGAAIRDLLSNEQDASAVAGELATFFASPLIRAVRSEKFSALQAMFELLPIDTLQTCEPLTGFNVLMQAAERGRSDVIMNYHRTLRDRYLDENLNTSQTYLSHIASTLRERFGFGKKAESFESQWDNIVNAQDRNGDTALLLAIKNNHELCVRVLLALRANIYIKNHAGQSSVSLAYYTDLYPAIRTIFWGFLNPEDQPHTKTVGKWHTPGETATTSEPMSNSSDSQRELLIYEWADAQAQKAFEEQVKGWVERIELEGLAAYAGGLACKDKLSG